MTKRQVIKDDSVNIEDVESSQSYLYCDDNDPYDSFYKCVCISVKKYAFVALCGTQLSQPYSGSTIRACIEKAIDGGQIVYELEDMDEFTNWVK